MMSKSLYQRVPLDPDHPCLLPALLAEQLAALVDQRVRPRRDDVLEPKVLPAVRLTPSLLDPELFGGGGLKP